MVDSVTVAIALAGAASKRAIISKFNVCCVIRNTREARERQQIGAVPLRQ